jgi:phytoene synthase
MDLDHTRYATFEALSQYCRRVASAVGLICVEIFGYRDQRAREYADSLGMALQLTNIIRDVAVDLRRGRVYLPDEDLARFGVTVDDLAAGKVTPAVRELLRHQCGRAREFYALAAQQMPRVDRRSLVAAEIMGAIYFEILRRIERSGYDVFTRRIRVPRPHRAAIALRAWLGALL